MIWLATGILLILFALGIRFAYGEKKKLAIFSTCLLILYGIGEGLASGIFPADKTAEVHTWTGIVHNVVSGAGVLAIMIYPLAMMRLMPNFTRISIIVFYIGTTGVILYAIGRLVSSPDNFLAVYKGSWQRLYVLVYYVYIITIAIRTIGGKDLDRLGTV